MTLTLVWVRCRVALEWRAFRVSSSEKSVFRETDFLYIFDKRSVASFPGASNDLCLVMEQVEIHVKRETGETAKGAGDSCGETSWLRAMWRQRS